MKPDIIVSSHDLDHLEGLLHNPDMRNRPGLAGLRAELERADVREPDAMPANVITMNSRARVREQPSGKEWELTLVYPGNAGEGKVSILTPAGSALLGLAAGQRIDWPSDDGRELHLEVLAIISQPSETQAQTD